MRPDRFLGFLPIRLRRLPRRALTLAFLCFVAHAPTAIAQYMYLDANQDGVHTAADVVNPSGSTVFDIWFRTDSNRDGSPASCSTGDGSLTMIDYQLILHASDGTVSWGPYTNAQSATMPSLFASEFDTTDAYVWFSGLTSLPPGSYKLGTIAATVLTGTPSLGVAPDSHLSVAYITAFRSSCSGTDFDNYLKLGPNSNGPGDWFDAAGLPFGGAAEHAPILARLSDLTTHEGQVDSLAVSAT